MDRMKRSLCFFLLSMIAGVAQAQLSTERAGTSQLLIAAAGSLVGFNGTFFRSDITLINYRDADQLVRLQWLPQGSSGVAVTPVDITLPRQSGINREDFVPDVLGQSGLGSILVTAITSNGQFDPGGRLHATSRIWSNQPGLSTGTVSQSFPIIAFADINSTRLLVLGHRRDARYRTNLGLVNLDPQAQTFQITVQADSRTELLNVPVHPLSMEQISLTGPPAVNVQIAVTNVTQGFQTTRFVAYGSSVDNTTGDSWSSLGYVVNP
jgi:hypothetical protein